MICSTIVKQKNRNTSLVEKNLLTREHIITNLMCFFGKILIPAISIVAVLKIPFSEAFNASRDVRFELHTRNSHSNNFEILVADQNRHNVSEITNFDYNKPTRIFVHGFNSNHKVIVRCTTAFLKDNDYNCIAVNWLRGSNTLNYATARERVDQVSAESQV